ncbi:MAG: invasin domain 3-containing protein [Candidatus Eisenbacteria bacterium]|nr:invasin domain 3-containing protein [Candidatus Eisenbacteria bacterium]
MLHSRNRLRLGKAGVTVAELLVVMALLALLLLSVYRVLIKSVESSISGQSLQEVEQLANMASQWIVNDLRPAGYTLGVGDTAFAQATTEEIEFLGDIDADGTSERVKYYLGTTQELSRTINPRDRYLYRSIDGESPGRRVTEGIVSLQFDFFDNARVSLLDHSVEPPAVRADPFLADKNANGISDVVDIRLVSVSILCESGKQAPKSAGNYFKTTVVTSVAPPNLPILARGLRGTAPPSEPGGEGGMVPASILFSASPETIIADGLSTSELTALVTDQAGVGISGLTVSMTVLSGPGNLGNVADAGTGEYEATFMSSASIGTALIEASTSELADTTSVVLVLPAASIGLTADPDRIFADGSSTSIIKAFVKDANGNRLAGVNVRMSFTQRVGDDALSSVSYQSSDTSYVATYTSATRPGVATILCQAEGLSGTVDVLNYWYHVLPVSERVLHVKLADIQEDVDQDLDIFVGRPYPASEIVVFTNSGAENGHMREFGAVYFDALDAPLGMAVEKMRDDRFDVVVATGSNSYQKMQEIFNGDPRGTLTSSTIYERSFGGKTVSLATGKLYYQAGTPDNSIDCVVGTDAGQFEIWLNDGSGGRNSLFYNNTFPKGGRFLSGIPYAVKTGDAREDASGDVDIFIGAGTSLELWFANPGADFGKQSSSRPNDVFGEGSKILSLDVGDIEKDGYIDIVAGEENGVIQVFKNNGKKKAGDFIRTGRFQAGGSVYCLKLCDLNKDGWLDLVAGTSNNEFEVRLSNGNGSFLQPTAYATAMFGVVSTVDCGDMKKDGGQGNIDIVVGVNLFAGFGFVEIWSNNGNGTFRGPDIP